jgi:hypothetical protein
VLLPSADRFIPACSLLCGCGGKLSFNMRINIEQMLWKIMLRRIVGRKKDRTIRFGRTFHKEL